MPTSVRKRGPTAKQRILQSLRCKRDDNALWLDNQPVARPPHKHRSWLTTSTSIDSGASTRSSLTTEEDAVQASRQSPRSIARVRNSPSPTASRQRRRPLAAVPEQPSETREHVLPSKPIDDAVLEQASIQISSARQWLNNWKQNRDGGSVCSELSDNRQIAMGPSFCASSLTSSSYGTSTITSNSTESYMTEGDLRHLLRVASNNMRVYETIHESAHEVVQEKPSPRRSPRTNQEVQSVCSERIEPTELFACERVSSPPSMLRKIPTAEKFLEDNEFEPNEPDAMGEKHVMFNVKQRDQLQANLFGCDLSPMMRLQDDRGSFDTDLLSDGTNEDDAESTISAWIGKLALRQVSEDNPFAEVSKTGLLEAFNPFGESDGNHETIHAQQMYVEAIYSDLSMDYEEENLFETGSPTNVMDQILEDQAEVESLKATVTNTSAANPSTGDEVEVGEEEFLRQFQNFSTSRRQRTVDEGDFSPAIPRRPSFAEC